MPSHAEKKHAPLGALAISSSPEAPPPATLTLGLYSHGANYGITTETFSRKQLVQYLNNFVASHAPTPTCWTSLYINRNWPVPVHADVHNLWGSANLSISLGPFSGGELWLEVSEDEASKAPTRWVNMPTGEQVPGVVVNSRHRMIRFCPKLRHAVLPWTGSRISITAYVTRGIEHIGRSLLNELAKLRFPCSSQVLTAAELVKTNTGIHKACKISLSEAIPEVAGSDSQRLHTSSAEAAREQEVSDPTRDAVSGYHLNRNTITIPQVFIVVEEMPSVSATLHNKQAIRPSICTTIMSIRPRPHTCHSTSKHTGCEGFGRIFR